MRRLDCRYARLGLTLQPYRVNSQLQDRLTCRDLILAIRGIVIALERTKPLSPQP
jgi:hypothetical protein